MILILMRHAKSSWVAEGLSDIERPLNDRGRTDALEAGRLLSKTFGRVETVFCSSSKRTRETLQLLQQHLPTQHVSIVPSLYSGDASHYIQAVESASASTSVLLIGHNPTISSLAGLLTGEYRLHLSTCSYMAFEYEIADWKDFMANRPKLLLYKNFSKHQA